MSDKINIPEILARNIVNEIRPGFPGSSEQRLQKLAWLFLNMDSDSSKGLMNGIKEVLETVIDKCEQKSRVSLTDYHTMKKVLVEEYTCGLKAEEPALVIQVDKESILNVKTMIDYE